MRLSFSHRIGSALCVAFWMLNPAAPSWAQTEPDPQTQAGSQPQPQAQAGAQPQPQTQGSVVFLLAPELHPAIAAGLSDAMEAQLTGTGTTLHWDTLTAPSTDLRAAIDQGKPTAALHQAAGVFWLDASGENDWLLYLMDAAGERILARRMENAARVPTASIEAIAVIVRESAIALIAGRPIAMDPVVTVTTPPVVEPAAPIVAPATPPVAAPAPTPAPAPNVTPSPLRVAIGYAGSPLSTDVPWQHGLALQAAWLTSFGGFVGVGYTLLPSLDVSDAGVSMSLHRRPIRLLAGLAQRLGEHVRLDLEAAAILDVATRTTRAVPNATAASDEATAWIFGAGLGLRLNVIPQPNVELYLILGTEGFFNRFEYVVDRDQDVTLLSPWSVSPVAELGVAFRP